MAYSIETKDGIRIDNIPDNVERNSQELKDRVSAIRAERGMTEPSAQENKSERQTAFSQVITGAGKRLEEMGAGVKGAGLRAGSAIGIVPEEALQKYQQQVEQSRSVMSPEYGKTEPQTLFEMIGGTGVDLATMYGLGGGLKKVGSMVGGPAGQTAEYVGGSLMVPRTIPQAGLGGALYSQTYPFATGQEAAGSAALTAGLSGALQPVLRGLGIAPPTESALPIAQQQAAKRAIEAGFQFTPAQISGSKTGMFIEEGIKALPLARGAYVKLEEANQQTLQKIAAKSIGLKEGIPFTPQSMLDAYNNAFSKYEAIKSVPSLKLDKAFGQEVDRILAHFKKIPESQQTQLGVPEIRKVLEEYKDFTKNAVDGETMFFGLKAIGDQLFTAQKQGTIGAGAYKDLRTAFENAIERAITQPSKKNLVNQDVITKFKDGRSQLSNWFTVDEAFNAATGELSGAKIAGSLARKSNFGGRNTELETAALAVRAFPRALPSSGTAERAEAAGMVKQAAQALTLPAIGAGITGMYTQDPYAAAAGAATAQMIPALAARISTSAPVRTIVAKRQLGAVTPDEGILSQTARMIGRGEEAIPQTLRFGLGDLARIYAERQQLQGLLGE